MTKALAKTSPAEAKESTYTDFVFYELLRMPLRAMRVTIIPSLLLITLIFVALAHPGNRLVIGTWCTVATLTWLTGAIHARYRLKTVLNPATAKRLILELKLIYAIEGATWGSLAWVTLDSTSPMVNMLPITAIAGIAATRMMLLSPIPSVFLTYILIGAALWVPKTLLLEGVPFHALGLAGILYVLTLIFQARIHSRTLSTSIRLRFESQELLKKLNAQMEIVEAARRQAEEANRAKSKFLAAVSHDLRQPAHALELFLDVISRTQLDARQSELLENSRAAARSSSAMLEALLDLSRIEAGVVKPQLKIFHLQPLLHKIERELGAEADAKGLVYRSRETKLGVYGDPTLLELILRNLVSNAIRYTEHGGLLVGCRSREGKAELEVWDTGVGIPAQHQKDVFREFLQLGNPERDRNKGLGLGLAIASGLAQRLGHDLTLSSRPGRGSVFRLSLPIAARVEPATARVPENERDLRHVRVLVIEDDDAVRAGMWHLLVDWGCLCDAVESIEEALVIARQRPPAVAICDYRLRGELTGADAIRMLRAALGDSYPSYPSRHALPALLITGDTAPDRLEEAYASGIPLLHKPVQAEVLYRQLLALLPTHNAVPKIEAATAGQ